MEAISLRIGVLLLAALDFGLQGGVVRGLSSGSRQFSGCSFAVKSQDHVHGVVLDGRCLWCSLWFFLQRYSAPECLNI